MANPEHLAILQRAVAKKNISIWNEWLRRQRTQFLNFRPDLTAVHFPHVNLGTADLSRTYLSDSDFSHSALVGVDFSFSKLERSDLRFTSMGKTDFFGTDLSDANLSQADLREVRFGHGSLKNTNFTEAYFGYTELLGVDLSVAKGLETVTHKYESFMDFFTLYYSKGNIPEVFLRGCGVPETMITFAKSLVDKPIQYYSAFISYSDKDKLFATRLHNDLQANSVRVWFAPEDLKIGDPLKQKIDEAVKMYDKLILVLSENSIHRAWVHHEFSRALEKENREKRLVLFPIRLDDSVFDTTEQWAYDIRQRHIGDFTNWQNPLAYQGAINRLLKDLNAKT